MRKPWWRKLLLVLGVVAYAALVYFALLAVRDLIVLVLLVYLVRGILGG